MTPVDIYQEVTDRIIAALEAGTVPWRQPWSSLGGPRNLDGRPYRGINTFLLELSGYSDPRWGTYRMIQAHDGQVRKGEKGCRVILWKPVPRKPEQADGTQSAGTAGSYMLLRTFTVFNAEQCDGLPEIETPEQGESEHERHETAEALVEHYPRRPFIAYGGDRAYYTPDKDMVRMPELGAFESADAYYGTLFHELIHSTGHESRLKRIEPALFGTDPYAREELIAEMGAAMLCGISGLQPRIEESASYIASWLKRLRDDRKLVITAAAQAQKAADHILGTAFEKPEIRETTETLQVATPAAIPVAA